MDRQYNVCLRHRSLIKMSFLLKYWLGMCSAWSSCLMLKMTNSKCPVALASGGLWWLQRSHSPGTPNGAPQRKIHLPTFQERWDRMICAKWYVYYYHDTIWPKFILFCFFYHDNCSSSMSSYSWVECKSGSSQRSLLVHVTITSRMFAKMSEANINIIPNCKHFFCPPDPVSYYNPLHIAVLRNRPKMARLLVSHGADIEKRDRVRELSPLCFCPLPLLVLLAYVYSSPPRSMRAVLWIWPVRNRKDSPACSPCWTWVLM